MDLEPGQRHPNYVGLNLVGYGLAKFEYEMIAALGFKSKAELYRDLISRGLAKTRGTLKNRQDLFNPLVRGGKIGWWQNGWRVMVVWECQASDSSSVGRRLVRFLGR